MPDIGQFPSHFDKCNISGHSHREMKFKSRRILPTIKLFLSQPSHFRELSSLKKRETSIDDVTAVILMQIIPEIWHSVPAPAPFDSASAKGDPRRSRGRAHRPPPVDHVLTWPAGPPCCRPEKSRSAHAAAFSQKSTTTRTGWRLLTGPQTTAAPRTWTCLPVVLFTCLPVYGRSAAAASRFSPQTPQPPLDVVVLDIISILIAHFTL